MLVNGCAAVERLNRICHVRPVSEGDSVSNSCGSVAGHGCRSIDSEPNAVTFVKKSQMWPLELFFRVERENAFAAKSICACLQTFFDKVVHLASRDQK